MVKLNEKYSYDDDKTKKKEGGCGTVYNIIEDNNLVVKKCKYSKDEKNENHIIIRAKRFDLEIEFLLKYKFDFAPKIFEYLFADNKKKKSWYIMEKCIPLLDAYKQNAQFFTIENKLKICIQLLNYIEILHNNGIAHRDIKPSNILFRNNVNLEELLLSDYGLIKTEDINLTEYGGQIGSNTFTAPEIRFIDKELPANYYFKCDIYSFVKTVWSIIKMKAYSFNYDTNLTLNENLFDYKDIGMKGLCLEPIYEIIDRGISYNREERPSIDECRKYINCVLNQINNPSYKVDKIYYLKNKLRDFHIINKNSSINDKQKCFTFIQTISPWGLFKIGENNENIEFYDKNIDSPDNIYYILRYKIAMRNYFIKCNIDHIMIDEQTEVYLYIKNIQYSEDNCNYNPINDNYLNSNLLIEIKYKLS